MLWYTSKNVFYIKLQWKKFKLVTAVSQRQKFMKKVNLEKTRSY